MPWRAAVARQDRIAQNSSAPVMERMQPEILIRSLLIRIALSASLLSLSGCRNNDNNVSERGAKAAKRHQAASGYWHSLATLGRWCRLRSYLDSAAAHGIPALDAVADALAGKPWPIATPRHHLTPVLAPREWTPRKDVDGSCPVPEGITAAFGDLTLLEPGLVWDWRPDSDAAATSSDS
jgi:hypothetical protein